MGTSLMENSDVRRRLFGGVYDYVSAIVTYAITENKKIIPIHPYNETLGLKTPYFIAFAGLLTSIYY